MMSSKLSTILQSTRPPFLLLTPMCVLLGWSTAFATHQPLEFTQGLLVLLGALCAHVSVNALNEYQDFRSGLDAITTRTPFSGGSGALPAQPAVAKAVLLTSLLALITTAFIGWHLLQQSDYRLLIIGLIGLILIVSYTPWINRQPLLCLLAPGTGFGLLMVMGTHLVLTGSRGALPWAIAAVPFFLVNNLLLLNQFPDVKADQSVGRRTLPIVFGLRVSSAVYGLFAFCAFTIIGLLILLQQIPTLAVLAILPLALAVYAWRGAGVYGALIGQYPRYLAANVAAVLLTPLLLALAILFG